MKALRRVETAAALIGLVTSVAGLVFFLVRELVPTEFVLSILTALGAFFAGLMAQRLASGVREFQRANRVFISYTKDQESVARLLRDELRRTGTRVWIDREQIRPGENWRIAIKQAIDDTDLMIAFLPKTPTTGLSEELRLAQQRGIRIIPVVSGETIVPPDLQNVSYIDVSGEDPQHAVKTLIEAAV